MNLIDQLKVKIGEELASDLILRDPHTIQCLAPPGEAGVADITLLDRDLELKREAGVFSYIKIPEDSVSGTVSQTPAKPLGEEAGKKPGDPTRPASNWWMVHRDLEHTSRAPTDQLVPISKLWQRTFADALLFTQPIVGDNLVLVGVYGNGDEAFVALDPQNGNVLWARTKDQNGGGVVSGTPVAVNERVYFVEHSLDTRQLTCLKIADGTEVWSKSLAANSHSGLAAAFGNIYLITRDGVLHAYDAQNGNVVWERSGIDVGTGQTLSSPAIGFGNVYVGSHQGLRAFDASTGAPKWSATSPLNGNASPLVVYDVGVGNPAVVVIGAEDNKLRAYHVTSGQQLWEYSGDIGLWYTTPATNEGKIYLMQQRTVVELDAVTGQLTKTSPDLGETIDAGPTIAKGHLFVIMRDDRMIILNQADLSIATQANIPSHSSGDFGSPSVENGKLYLWAAETDPYPSASDTIHAFHKSCLIATAAYGSPLAPPVSFLRGVRDMQIKRTATGRALIDAFESVYYKFSPRVSKAMYQSTPLRHTIRWLVVAPCVHSLMLIVKLFMKNRNGVQRLSNS